MDSHAPLLNQYKYNYLLRRLPQTILGGPTFRFGYNVPIYIYVSQIVLLCYPCLFGIIGNTLVTYNITENLVLVCCVAGFLNLILTVGLHIASHTIQERTDRPVTNPLNKVTNMLSEDDCVNFKGFLDADTWRFLIPKKQFKVNVILHCVLSSVIIATSIWYLLPIGLQSIGSSLVVSLIVCIVGWPVVCVSNYSLVWKRPPESAVYDADNPFEVLALYRPFYVSLFLFVHFAVAVFVQNEHSLNLYCHYLFPFLLLLWPSSILPPVRALLPWCMEQCLVHALGGSPMASNIRLSIMFLVSTACVPIVWYLSLNPVFACAIGCILSWDHAGIAATVLGKYRKFRLTPEVEKLQSGRTEVTLSDYGQSWTPIALIYSFVMLTLGAGAAAVFVYAVVVDEFITSVLQWSVVLVWLLVTLNKNVQRLYVLNLCRNPFFPKYLDNRDKFSDSKSRFTPLAWGNRLLVGFLAPLLLLSALASIQKEELPSATFTSSLAITFAFRRLWQDTPSFLFDVSVFACLKSISATESLFLSIGSFEMLLLVSLAVAKLQEFVNKIHFIVSLMFYALHDKTQRHRANPVLVVLNAVFFPVTMAIITLSCVLSAPLLPLFTLPLFIVGFPRPTKFWPGTVGDAASKSNDTVYYEHLVPKLLAPLSRMMWSQSLGGPHPGEHYLLRMSNMLLWIIVLEKGFNYSTLSIRGLELQETSCHTVEALHIDEVFDSCYSDNSELRKCSIFTNVLSIFKPREAFLCDSYSDAKSQLTGIVDSPDFANSLKTTFMSTFVWMMLKNLSSGKLKRHPGHHGIDDGLIKAFSASPSRQDQSAVRSSFQVLAPKQPERPLVLGLVSSHSFRRRSTISECSFRSFGDNSSEDILGFCDRDADFGDDLDVTKEATKVSNDNEDAFSADSIVGLNDILRELQPETRGEQDGANLSKPTAERTKSGLSKNDSMDNDHISLSSAKIPFMPYEPISNNQKTHVEIISMKNAFNQKKLQQSQVNNCHNVSGSGLNIPGGGQNMPGSGHNVPGSCLHDESDHESLLRIPKNWTNLDMGDCNMDALPRKWFQYVCKKFADKRGCMPIDFKQLEEEYALLCGVVWAIIDFSSPSSMLKNFNGNAPYHQLPDSLASDGSFRDLFTHSYRSSFKLTLDALIYGEPSSEQEMDEALTELEANCHVGPDDSLEWTTAIKADVHSLVSFGYDNEKMVYTSHVLTQTVIAVNAAVLNHEAVRGVWGSMALELFYMTNDDEERYSIQAHKQLLRNLSVQAANPPLGYPVYSSKPLTIITL